MCSRGKTGYEDETHPLKSEVKLPVYFVFYTDRSKKMEAKTKKFQTEDGLNIHVKTWPAASDKQLKAKILINHGFGENTDDYDDYLPDIAKEGYEISVFDQRGFGQTAQGKKDYGISNEYYVFEDLNALLKSLIDDSVVPVFLYGHSMGGAIVLNYMIKGKYKEEVSGYISSAPMVEVHSATSGKGINKLLAPFLGIAAKLMPKYKRVAQIDAKHLTHDEEKVRAKAPQMARRNLTSTELMNDAINRGKRLTSSVFVGKAVDKPLLVLHGNADKINAITGTRKFYSLLKIKDKTMLEYDGMFHELHEEDKERRDKVCGDVVKWLDDHVEKAQKELDERREAEAKKKEEEERKKREEEEAAAKKKQEEEEAAAKKKQEEEEEVAKKKDEESKKEGETAAIAGGSAAVVSSSEAKSESEPVKVPEEAPVKAEEAEIKAVSEPVSEETPKPVKEAQAASAATTTTSAPEPLPKPELGEPIKVPDATVPEQAETVKEVTESTSTEPVKQVDAEPKIDAPKPESEPIKVPEEAPLKAEEAEIKAVSEPVTEETPKPVEESVVEKAQEAATKAEDLPKSESGVTEVSNKADLPAGETTVKSVTEEAEDQAEPLKEATEEAEDSAAKVIPKPSSDSVKKAGNGSSKKKNNKKKNKKKK